MSLSVPHLARLVPAFAWLRDYRRADLPKDLTAGAITAVLLVPQGMAYAILAGLPVEVGLYASILPPAVYALFGTSRALAVGPVSVAALLVADALSSVGYVSGEPAYLTGALVLAALSGVLLLAMGLLRLGALASFLSHPVLSGFTSGAAIIIMISQIENLSGIPTPRGESAYPPLAYVVSHLAAVNVPTLVLGLASIATLVWAKRSLAGLLMRLGRSERVATALSRAGPLVLVLLTSGLVAVSGLHHHGVSIVGAIPAGLPAPALDFLNSDAGLDLLPAALLISLIGYVESVSVARVLAQRRRQKIDPNQELIALGLANGAAACVGTMPVAGGFSRSIVNYAAGAKTQLAGLVTAGLIALATLFFTPVFYFIPRAALAAIIVTAVVSLVDVKTLRSTWRFDKADSAVLLATFAGVLALGIEMGLAIGVALSLVIHLWRTGRPHIAEVGRVPHSEHYRNVNRHPVEQWPNLLLVRPDESIYFPNTGALERFIAERVADRRALRHVIVICSAINRIDHSGLEALEELRINLAEADVTLHLAEVKGPVMDRLKRVDFAAQLAPGEIYLSTEDAAFALAPSRSASTHSPDPNH